MSLRAIQTIPKNGSAVITYAVVDPGGVDDVPAQPGVVVKFLNTSAGGIGATQTSNKCSHGRTIVELVTVPAEAAGVNGAGEFSPGSDTAQWKQADGNYEYTHSGSTSLFIAAVKYA